MANVEYNTGLKSPDQAFAFIGFPWDMGASLGRPGARYAPNAIREACTWNTNRIQDGKLWDLETNTVVDLTNVRLRDMGDVPIASHDVLKTFGDAEALVSKALDQGEMPLIIGGDHSISLPGIRAVAAEGPVGIIQLDAHLDLVDDSPQQGRYSQSSQIRRALELPEVDPKRVVQIGLRGFNYPHYQEFAKQQGVHQLTTKEAVALGAKEAAAQALAWASQDGASVYFTLDIDVLDPSIAPGAGHLEFCGLSAEFVTELVRQCAPSIKAFDIAEVNPLFDHHGMTSNLAAKLLFDLIVGSLGYSLAHG